MIPDLVCPASVGESLIKLSPESPSAVPRAHQPFGIVIDTSSTAPNGVTLPIEIQVTSGSSAPSFRRVVYRSQVPTRFVLTPREGGPHVVRVRELYHQRAVGVLHLDVQGDRGEDDRTL